MKRLCSPRKNCVELGFGCASSQQSLGTALTSRSMEVGPEVVDRDLGTRAAYPRRLTITSVRIKVVVAAWELVQRPVASRVRRQG